MGASFLKRILLVICILCANAVSAQSVFSISGIVLDEQGKPLPGATVFISGSLRITATDGEGKFSFQKIVPGSHQVAVQVIGYYPGSQDVTITEQSVDIKIWMKVKPTALKEVVIGGRDYNDKYYTLFKRELLGETENGKDCTLLNPEVVRLTVGKKYLTADANDFLIVINKRLGYKIRCQLIDFMHLLGTNQSALHLSMSFEELWGTDAMKREWAENRAETYKESFRHFLRAVYKGTVLKEGFVVRERFNPPVYDNYPGALYVSTHPVKFDSLTHVVDSAFKALHFISLYAYYDPVGAIAYKYQDGPVQVKPEKRAVISTLLDMGSKQPMLIDRQGTCVNCTVQVGVSLNGKWGLQRLGDQVPSDYEPDKELKF